MILAVIRDNPYNLVLLLHILAVMAAYAPAFVHPFIGKQADELDAANRGKLFQFMSANGRRVYAPALIVAGLLGFALQGMSDGVWEFGQTWMWGAIVVWLAMNGVLHAMVLPAERAVGAGDAAARRKVDTGGMVLTLLLIVMLYLMVFKPGL